MAALNIITYNVILSLLVIILASEARGKQHVVVDIINNLNTTGSKSLTIHCKSKDDDLGFHTRLPGEIYNFSFIPDFFWRTLFFCSFTWESEPNPHYLDIYKGYRDQECGLLYWIINANGGCMHCYLDPSTVCYPWNSKASKYMEVGTRNNALM